MQPERDESRVSINRLLKVSGWDLSEIYEEENLLSGRMDYRMADLCILEAKRPTNPNKQYSLKLHIQQPQRYHESVNYIPFLMVSDGELHYIQDTRNGRIERLYTIPTKEQLIALLDDSAALRNGYIYQPSNLFDFQDEAIQEVISRIVDGNKDEKMLLEMATGTGKTVVAGGIINQINKIMLERENRSVSVLFLVDRDALEDQSADKLIHHVKSLKVNTIESIGESRVDVLVAQVATMQHRYNRQPFHPSYFDLIIIDEAHRSIHGGVWRSVVEYFNCPQVGLTATPPRFGDEETTNYFGQPIFILSYDDGVARGMLAPAVIHRVKTNVDLNGIMIGDKLYKSEDFEVQVHIDNRDWTIVNYYEKNFYGKKCLVFAAGTNHVASLWEKFNEMFKSHNDGYKSKFVVSSVDSSKARKEIIEEFQESESDIKVLINLNILTAGFDYPELDLLFMCRFTRHKSLYLQMKGRGSRLPFDTQGKILTDINGKPIKDRFTMVDFAGVTTWEDREFVPHIPDKMPEDDQDTVVNTDPTGGAGQNLIIDVDINVQIAEVEIIDPFANRQSEEDIILNLSTELNRTKEELDEEKNKSESYESELTNLRATLEMERRSKLAVQGEAFRQLIISLRNFSPFVPITEEVLKKVNPSVISLDILNEVFNVQRSTLQEHIDSIIREEVNLGN